MLWQIEKSWHEVLKNELKAPFVSELKAFIEEQEKAGAEVYPPQTEVFRSFALTPFDKVSVVVVGQDPYHGPGQAHGLSFSVKPGIKVPPSLKNIYKELANDVGFSAPDHGFLEAWAKQGVLLLNATLTVRRGEPKSHYNRGWEIFTDIVCQKLLEEKEHVVFLLWGKSAKEKITNIAGFETFAKKHLILTAAHPSPYSATGFFGCHHFSKANKYLAKWGKPLIDWQL